MGLTLINTTGAISGGTGNVEITGLSSAYKAYEFHFYDLHLAESQGDFEFQVNTSYNQNINSTALRMWTYDNDTHSKDFTYQDSADQHVGEASDIFCCLAEQVNSSNTENSLSGVMVLFDPSSTTYSKHFIAKTDMQTSTTYMQYTQTAGYIKTTSAIDRIKFQFASSNIDSGEIKWFGYS